MDVYIRNFYSKLHESLMIKYFSFIDKNQNSMQSIQKSKKKIELAFISYIENTGNYNSFKLINNFDIKYEDRKALSIILSVILMKFNRVKIFRTLFSFFPAYIMISLILCRENLYFNRKF